MDAPVYKKLMDIENHQGNPFGTKHGQDNVSVVESFWARLAREGRPKGQAISNTTLPNNSTFVSTSLTPSVDCILYPRYINVSATVDCELDIQINTNIPQLGTFYAFRGFIKAGTPIQITTDGDVQIMPGGTVVIGAVNSGAAAGAVYGSIFGYEVNLNV